MNIKHTYLFVLLLLLAQAAGAQIVVSGRVTGADGEALIGATVAVKEGKGAVTDIEGHYQLTAPSPETELVFTYIGMRPRTEIVGDRRTIDVVLEENNALIDEVVVVGYGSQKRSNISGAVSTVTASEISETPVLRVEQALQGRTAGVQVTQNSGSPGSPLTVRVRGTGTINNSDPLYIVDGIPVDGLDFLNPNDIETINVLKDAASAAIYGSRGANGVVLITTRTGKKNQDGKIAYDAYFGIQSAWKKANLMNAREYAILSNEAHVAAGQAPLPEFSNPELLGNGTDWLDAIFGDAPMTSHQLSLTGGGDKSTYTVSGNYFDQEGIVGGDKSGFRRYTARINGTNAVKKWLNVGTNLGLTNLSRRFLPENNEFTTPLVRALNMDPVTPIRKSDGTYAYSRYSDTDIINPVNAIEQTYDRWKSNRIVGALFGDLMLAPGLQFRSSYSVDATFATRNIFYPTFDLSSDPVLSDAPAGEKRAINSVVLQHNNWSTWQWENVLTWDHQFGESHHLTLTGGTTALENRYEYSGGANSNLPSNDPDDAYISNTIDPITAQSAYGGADESSLLSVFGRANYVLREKYLFSAALRADGSSRFGPNNRYGYFPSVSAGWILSEEDFWHSKVLEYLKIRASWGQNGNDRIGNYGFTSVVLSGQNYTFGPDQIITNGSVPLTVSNPDLRWETITQTDLGFDATFLNGRLTWTSDFYIKNTSGMLYAAPIPLTVGANPPIRNIASVKNTGWETDLNYRQRVGAFKYSIGGNFSMVKNEVTGLGEGGEPVYAGRVQSANASVTKTEVGQTIGAFYGYVTDGLFQSREEIAAHAFQNEATAPGDIRFMDLNNDGVVNNDDQTYIGNPIPDFTYGINADVEWKGIDLGIFLQGAYGNEIYNATVRYDFTYVNRPVSVLNRWTGPGTSNSEPRVSLSDPNQNARVSDRFVEDGSYLRLKNVQLGYSLPKTVLKRIGFEKFRVYASAQNMFTFTKYTGMDPEIGSYGGALEAGIDRGFYPQARVLLGGINVIF
ncbi:MAG TPA: TonB-dependent receptor [Saprospiraceae bacterium]|nr:TonB-dependent receptor [Saprospiraceae bacterium]HPI08389.1 TonB-dependent receptor [Saprospiraceae bacterium]